jgi:hypothetical protein
MTDHEFAQLLSLCDREFVEKQEKFQMWIATSGMWFYDLEECTLTLGDTKFEVTPIGTYGATSGTWLWAWANSEFPPKAIERAEKLKCLYELTGWEVFENPGTHATVDELQIFNLLAIHILDSVGLFQDGEGGEPALYLAVHEAQ